MKKLFLFILLIFFFNCCDTSHIIETNNLTVISQPIIIDKEGLLFEGNENLMLVPENRNNIKSRLITLHFFRFPAKEKSELPPVFYLPAGPGEPYTTKHFYEYYHGKRAKVWSQELLALNQKRDLILLNQRGNPDAPGLQLQGFDYRWKNGDLKKPFSIKDRAINRANALEKKVKYFSEKGVDLKGYDIKHLVDDIESVRKHFGYKKLAFVGNSFGSQWCLAYLKKYPANVDRALLSGVEPLNHTYDDPDGIWNVFKRIEKYALNEPEIAKNLPEIGLLGAYKEIIKRLEKEPVKVQLNIPEEDLNQTVLLGADDFRFNHMYPYADSKAEKVASWPKYITEIYNRDYRLLTLRSLGRDSNSSDLIMAPLIDNSLGISNERSQILKSRESSRWVGDINAYYEYTNKVSPTKKVDDRFRNQEINKVPVVIIHGELDMSTPHSNATYLMNYFPNGHLITVKKGSHSAKRELFLANSTLKDKILGFMNVDFRKINFEDYKNELPKEVNLPNIDFWDIKGESLYEKQFSD